jgi:hypothetical protein
VAYTVLRAEEQVLERPNWRPEEPMRRIVELPLHAPLPPLAGQSLALPARVARSATSRTFQEEVFSVVEGTLTMLLGEPPERFELPARSLVVKPALEAFCVERLHRRRPRAGPSNRHRLPERSRRAVVRRRTRVAAARPAHADAQP